MFPFGDVILHHVFEVVNAYIFLWETTDCGLLHDGIKTHAVIIYSQAELVKPLTFG